MHAEKRLMFHVDLKHPMWRMDYMKSVLRRAAGLGYNAVYLEFEDKLQIRKHPEVSHPEAMTHAEAEELRDCCEELGLDIVPLVQSLGHAEFVLGKDKYAHLREAPEISSQYDPFSDEARKLIIDIYDEAIECFKPRTFLHVGGDEAPALGRSPKGREFVERHGYEELYLLHMLPLLEYVHSRGLRPIISSDMILDHIEIVERIPRYVVIMDWDYLITGERREKLFIWGKGLMSYDEFMAWEDGKKNLLARFCLDEQSAIDKTFLSFYYAPFLESMGFDVLTACATRSYGDSPGIPHHNEHICNCFYSARKGSECLGNMVTSWAIRRNHPELGWPAAIAAARGFHDGGSLSTGLIERCFQDAGRAECVSSFVDFFTPVKGWSDVMTQKNIVERMAPEKLDLNDRGVLRSHIASFYGSESEALLDMIRLRSEYVRLGSTVAHDTCSAGTLEMDYWYEGINLNILYLDCFIAVLDDTIQDRAACLKERLEKLESISRDLFLRTYRPVGAQLEVDIRFRLLHRILVSMNAPTDFRFSFVHATDLHFESGNNFDVPLAEARSRCFVKDVNDERHVSLPSFAVITGDLTQRGSAVRGELEAARELLGTLRVPWFVVAGNHDFAPDKDMAAQYPGKEDYHAGAFATSGVGRVFGRESLIFSHVRGGIKFVGVTLRNGDPDSVLDLLEAELASEHAKIVLCHYGLYPPRDAGPLATWGFRRISTLLPRLRSMIENPGARVVAYLYGHNHVNSVRIEKGIFHVSSGGLQKGCTGYRCFEVCERVIRSRYFLLSNGNLHDFNYWGLRNPEACCDSTHPDCLSYHMGNQDEMSFEIRLEETPS